MISSIITFFCYVAACVFFAFLVFDWSMGDTNRLADGLFCLALGFAVSSWRSLVVFEAEVRARRTSGR